jgi:hypothetical protein
VDLVRTLGSWTSYVAIRVQKRATALTTCRLPITPPVMAFLLAALLALFCAATVAHAGSSTAPERTTETIVKRQKAGGAERTATTTSITTGATPQPDTKAEPAPFDWESPDTWGAVATGGGFLVAAGTLFVGFLVRRSDTRKERRRSQQEWAVRAAATADALRAELEGEGDGMSTSTGALHRRDRLREILKQVDIADGSLITLADGGDKRTRDPVMSILGDLKARTDSLANEYDWIARLHQRLELRPGSKSEAGLLAQARTDVAKQQLELLTASSDFKRALGAWLEASKAVPAEVRHRVGGTNAKDAAAREKPPAIPPAP